MADDGLSEYEQLRIRNILRNEEELRRLGLDVSALTNAALGRNKPIPRKRAVPRPSTPQQPTRRSERIAALPPPSPSPQPGIDEPAPKRVRRQSSAPPPPPRPDSCRNLDVDLTLLTIGGEIQPINATQFKRGVMEAASRVPPTFSRMSGIQEWHNCIYLFVNVYGDGYKNVLLKEGQEITWFAQPRHWEGTPVVQRLINSQGGLLEDGTHLEPTPVALFCRRLDKPFVYCGTLTYLGHDPDRIPIRFVWQLDHFEQLTQSAHFRALIEDCKALLRR